MNLRTLFLSTVLLGIASAQLQAQTLDRFQVGRQVGPAPEGNPPAGTNINVWPQSGGENPINAIDGNLTNKYLNFGEINTGYLFTLSTGTAVANGLSLTTGNDAPERDPATVSIYGSNSVVASATPGTTYDLSLFTPIILNLATGLITNPGRNVTAAPLTFPNTTAYSTYLVIFPTVINSSTANSMQIAEARLTNAGTPISNTGTIAGGQLIPEPASTALLGAAVGMLALRRRRK